MTQVVPAESCDRGAFEKVLPRGLESRGDIKNTSRTSRVFAPAAQYTRGFIIQRYVAGLAALCVASFDGQKPAVEIDRAPTKL